MDYLGKEWGLRAMALRNLFESIEIRKMEVKNRVVLAPVATTFAAIASGICEGMIDCHEARARGGAGLMIAALSPAGRLMVDNRIAVGLWEDRLINAMLFR